MSASQHASITEDSLRDAMAGKEKPELELPELQPARTPTADILAEDRQD